MVAHTSGGREVAGSSPVIPTERKPKLLIINILGFFYILNWRDFGEMFLGFLSSFLSVILVLSIFSRGIKIESLFFAVVIYH